MMIKQKIKTYSELLKLKTFRERFEYLKLDGVVSEETFGHDRFINQHFYKTKEWQDVRNYVITRDRGCDLGVLGYDILDDKIIVHHMNPISKDDILNRSEFVFDPEYLITTTNNTHNGIHYGISYDDFNLKNKEFITRQPNDTTPWKQH